MKYKERLFLIIASSAFVMFWMTMFCIALNMLTLI